MYKDKKVLLIAGGGTLGTYTAKELLRLASTGLSAEDFTPICEGLRIELERREKSL